jgi:hypothetical protein
MFSFNPNGESGAAVVPDKPEYGGGGLYARLLSVIQVPREV